MHRILIHIEDSVISWSRRWQESLARGALFLIYAWFGALKVFGVSPASDMVQAMHAKTLAFIPFGTFMILFGLFEVLIGVLFLIRGAERPALVLMLGHMVTTALPLLVLPAMVWTGFLVPTLEGQYIIKNIALIAIAVSITARLESSRT